LLVQSVELALIFMVVQAVALVALAEHLLAEELLVQAVQE
jgi:hypothetical protein